MHKAPWQEPSLPSGGREAISKKRAQKGVRYRGAQDKGQFQPILFALLKAFLLRMAYLLCCIVWVLPLILSEGETEPAGAEAVSHPLPEPKTEPRFREAEIMGKTSFAILKAFTFNLQKRNTGLEMLRDWFKTQSSSIAVSQLGIFADKHQNTALAYLTKKNVIY